MDTGKVDISAITTRISLLGRALPMRILLVDDDELEQAWLAERFTAMGFEVVRAQDGVQALALFEQQWFPLVVTDLSMPIMDGIALTESLRARGISDTYVIMLTARDEAHDYARGYAAGVDDYLTKRLPDVDLVARIHAAFNTIALRRSLKDAQQALLAASPIEARTGAFTANEAYSKLQAELRRAQRYARKLSVLLIGVHPESSAQGLDPDALRRVVESIQRTIRAHVDWIGHVEWTPQVATFAVVLPEAAPGDGPNIKERLRLRLTQLDAGVPLTFSFGLVGVERGENREDVTAKDFLDVAEHCRLCPGHTSPAQLNAVQRSVAVGARIACRHGYAVDRRCALMMEIDDAPRGNP